MPLRPGGKFILVVVPRYKRTAQLGFNLNENVIPEEMATLVIIILPDAVIK